MTLLQSAGLNKTYCTLDSYGKGNSTDAQGIKVAYRAMQRCQRK